MRGRAEGLIAQGTRGSPSAPSRHRPPSVAAALARGAPARDVPDPRRGRPAAPGEARHRRHGAGRIPLAAPGHPGHQRGPRTRQAPRRHRPWRQPAHAHPAGDLRQLPQAQCQRSDLVDFAELLQRTSCGCTTPACWRTTASASATCSSTSSRTPTPCRYAWIRVLAGQGGGGRRAQQGSWWATTRPAIPAGAARGRRTYSTSCAISPLRAPSAWNRTTARPRHPQGRQCGDRTTQPPGQGAVDGGRRRRAHRPVCRLQRAGRARYVVERIRELRGGAASGGDRHPSAPTRGRATSKNSWSATGCRTAFCAAACAFFVAPKSKDAWPICLIANRHDGRGLPGAVSTPPRGIGETRSTLHSTHGASVSLWEALLGALGGGSRLGRTQQERALRLRRTDRNWRANAPDRNHKARTC